MQVTETSAAEIAGAPPCADPAAPADTADAPAHPDTLGAVRLAQHRRALPPAWRAIDRTLVRASEVTLFVVGAAFTVLITLEVISRFVFSFSIFFVNALAQLLLVWFFMLGAGLALRQGAHVGFELLVSALAPARRRALLLAGYALSLVFFAEMIWGGIFSIAPAWPQTEGGLGVSVVWFVLAIPVGFVLLAYHLLVLVAVELRGGLESAGRP